jgi:NDP-sugar pyrophosphorylase family protein
VAGAGVSGFRVPRERALDALIFAAGLGTRLGPIGQSTPKALLEVGGVTMLERTVRRVVAGGADRVVVNVHHHAAQFERFLADHDLGVEIRVSHEAERPLETGGGLWHARDLFRRDRPILLHNVDVITDADLSAMVADHRRRTPLVTLAVQDRETPRRLLFDDDGLLGREDRRAPAKREESRSPRGEIRSLAFAGIHVCAPEILDLVTERGAFPILPVYLRLASAGRRILPWAYQGRWLEIGNAERLEAARAAIERTDAG